MTPHPPHPSRPTRLRGRETLVLCILTLLLAGLALAVDVSGWLPTSDHLPPRLDQAILVALVTALWLAVFMTWRWRDARNQLEAEEALKESHLRFQTLANATFEGLLIHDKGIILDVNDAFATLTGYPREELIGSSIYDLIPYTYHAELRERLRPLELSPCQSISPFEMELHNEAGRSLHMEIRGKAMPYMGRVVRVVAFHDMTERRKLEQAKDELIAVVSHELRSPLGSLHNSLELLAGGIVGELPPRCQRMVSIAMQSTRRLIRLTNQTLDYERLSYGQVTLEKTECRADDLLRKAAESMQGMADASGVQFEIQAPPIPVRADEDRIIQVLVNLLGNALKFAPPKSTIWLEAWASKTEVGFEIRDQGPGIPTTMQEAIFERFVQVEDQPRRRDGIGLGLAISKNLVTLHGGRIGVESQPGEGSCFRFTLPLTGALAHELRDST